MKVLQTAGQIAVHQVAANRFKAVRKVPKLKTRQGRIGKKGGVWAMRWGRIKPAKNAYEMAKAGDKHKGMYQNYLTRSPKELQKSVRSYQSGKRDINVHRDKITNPRKYDSNWDTYTRKNNKANLTTGKKRSITPLNKYKYCKAS